MIPLLFLLVSWRLSAAVHGYLQRYAPTNIAVRYLRSPRGLKWAIPAALVLTPAYSLLAYTSTAALNRGGPGWLNLLVLLFTWDAMKFGILGAFAPPLFLGGLVRAWMERDDQPLTPQ